MNETQFKQLVEMLQSTKMDDKQFKELITTLNAIDNKLENIKRGLDNLKNNA